VYINTVWCPPTNTCLIPFSFLSNVSLCSYLLDPKIETVWSGWSKAVWNAPKEKSVTPFLVRSVTFSAVLLCPSESLPNRDTDPSSYSNPECCTPNSTFTTPFLPLFKSHWPLELNPNILTVPLFYIMAVWCPPKLSDLIFLFMNTSFWPNWLPPNK